MNDEGGWERLGMVDSYQGVGEGTGDGYYLIVFLIFILFYLLFFFFVLCLLVSHALSLFK